MPKNRIIYLGIMILAATALLWLGIQLGRVQWMLPWLAGLGTALVVGGAIFELVKSRRKLP